MKLTPASRAFATMRPEVASSAGPPNIMVPRQIGEIFRPLRPRERYCIGISFTEVIGRIASRDRHCEEHLRRSNPVFPCGPGLLRFARNEEKNERRNNLQLPSFNILNTPLAVISVRSPFAVTSAVT